MYFSSRMQAGRMLGSMMTDKFRYEDCAIVALDDGGVVVGVQIAAALHCIITMLVTNEITLPKEPIAVGGITSDGKFSYNEEYSDGEIDELVGEYRNYLEEERTTKFKEVNSLLGQGGLISPKILRHMNVILVSDGLDHPMKLELANQYLKPIDIKSLVIAVPIATVPVIDKIHVMADSIFCLSVVEDFFDTGHYYDINDVPDHHKIVESIESIILSWK